MGGPEDSGSRKNQSKFIEDMVVRDEKTGRLALSCDKGSLEASMALDERATDAKLSLDWKKVSGHVPREESKITA